MQQILRSFSSALRLVFGVITILTWSSAQSQISYTTNGSSVSQNFDGILSTVPADNTTQSVPAWPAGWVFAENGAIATTYRVHTGTGTTGDTYLYGATANAERAIGALASAGNVSQMGVSFTNNTGSTLNQFTVNYTGEQWRNGGNTAVQQLEFQYSTSATGLVTGTYTSVSQLSFSSIINTATAAALNGNLAANRTAISFTVTNINWPNGATLWMKWVDINDSGNDHGLAVDDFSFSATFIAPPDPTLLVAPSQITFTPQTTLTATAGQSFAVSATNLSPASGNITFTAPAQFQVSADGTTWGATADVAYTGGTIPISPVSNVFVRFNPSAFGYFSGTVTATGGGLTTPPAVTVTGDAFNPPSIAINQVFNTGSNATEWYELLTLQALDLRNWSVNDYSGTGPNNTADGSFITFNNIAFWQTVPAGSFIVIHGIGSTATEDFDFSDDGVVRIRACNTSYFTQTGLPATWCAASVSQLGLNAASDVLQIRNGSIIVHSLEYRTSASTPYNPPVQMPKAFIDLLATALVGTGESVHFNNANSVNHFYTNSFLIRNTTNTTIGASNDATERTWVCGTLRGTSEPTTVASSVATSGITGNEISLNWTSGNGSRRIVVARLSATARVLPTDGTNYTANSDFGLGSTTGAGNFVVYVGTASNATITGLSVLTEYSFDIYELNGIGECVDYNTTVTTNTITESTILGVTITAATITGGPFCVSPTSLSATVNVAYTVTGTLNGGNVFTAQLSNASGSFLAPINIGTLNSTTDGTIVATIPAGTAAGAGYFIRVVSSDPVVTGTSTGVTVVSAPNNVTTLAAAPASTLVNLTWTNPATACFNDVMVVRRTGAFTSAVPSGNAYAVGDTFDGGTIAYIGSANSTVVSGLTNGTAYTFKVYTRAGNDWSNGVTVTSTPNLIPTITEVLVPQFTQGTTGTQNRIPTACLVTLGGLNPNTTYRYFNRLVTAASDGSATSTGAGVMIVPSASGNYTTFTNPNMSTEFGTFTTDAAGTYTGWFANETTNNTRFTPGNVVNFVIVLNNGTPGNTSSTTFLRTTSGSTIINLVNSAGANNGTGLWGVSNGAPRNFVAAYDNTTGSGRPLSISFIESDGVAQTTNYAAFYSANVNAVAGAFGLVIPNNNANGVQRIEQRSITGGAVTGCAVTDADGIWGTANTVNPTGGTTAIQIPTNLLFISERTWYLDADNDGYYNGTPITACTSPGAGYVTTPGLLPGDCADGNAAWNPAGTELCGNVFDENCNGQVNEGCTPLNDFWEGPQPLIVPNFPSCVTTSGSLALAAPSAESAYYPAAPGAGEDMWYRFRFSAGNTGVVRIQASSSVNDLAIVLQQEQPSAPFYSAVAQENAVTGVGTEIMTITLLPNVWYRVAVKNMTDIDGGAFTICVNQIRAVTCAFGASNPRGLCDQFQSAYTGANSYTFTFTNTAIPSEVFTKVLTGVGSNPSSSTVFLSTVPGLRYGATYNVSIATTYLLANGAGTVTTQTIPAAGIACQLNTIVQPVTELAVADRCINGQKVRSSVISTGWVCGVIDYTWEITPNTGLPVAVLTDRGFADRFIRVGSLLGINSGATSFNVRVRPVFSDGAGGRRNGEWGPAQELCLIAPIASPEIKGENELSRFETRMSQRAEDKLTISLYPNPTAGERVNILAQGMAADGALLRVFDITGAAVYSTRTIGTPIWSVWIDPTQWSAGIYLVEIISDTEKQSARLVVTK